MFKQILIAGVVAAGVFSGVSLENLRDTPRLKCEAIARFDRARLLQQARGVVPCPDDQDAVLIKSKNFRLEFAARLAPDTYSLAVEARAPNGSTDSFWVELDGKRQRRPFTLPIGRMRTAAFSLRIAGPGEHRVRVVLREAPGAKLRSVTLGKFRYSPPREPMLPQRAARHPRLFFTPDSLAALKARMNSPAGRRFYKLPGRFKRTPPPYSPKKRTCSAFLHMARYAFAQLLAPDPARRQKLIEWLRVAVTYPHWGRGSLADLDLDAEYMMEGMALTYDWLYDELPADLRGQVRDCIAEHCRRLYAASVNGRTGGGLNFQQNHFWFAHLALGLGAAAVYGEAPEAREWLGWAFDRFERVFITLADDGGFHEQPGYWDYSMPTLFKMIDLYEQCTGLRIPHGDEGLRKAAAFRWHFVYPGFKLTAAFGDTPISKSPPPANLMLWLAKRYRDPVAMGLAEKRRFKPYTQWTRLLWLDETLKPCDPFKVIPLAQWYKDAQMAFARTSWGPDATMFAFISRPLGGEKWAALCRRYNLGGTGHNHPAQNHFVLFGRGQVLAADPGYTYKKLTRNHNTILVDGRGQLGDGEKWPRPNAGRARILGFTASDGVYAVTGEAASAYPKDLGLTRFERTLVMASRDVVVVYDRLAAKQPRQFTWRLHFYGRAERKPPGWRLTVGRAQLDVLPLLPAAAAGRVLAEAPLYVSSERNLTPKQATIQVLEFTAGPSRDAAFLTLLLVGDADAPRPAARLVRGDGYDAARIGDVFIAFNRGDRAMTAALPNGRSMRTRAKALVWLRRGGRERVVEHAAQPAPRRLRHAAMPAGFASRAAKCRKRRMRRFIPIWFALVSPMSLVHGAARGDWPQWRYDARRTAAAPQELPAQLRLLWKRVLPPPKPAFPQDNRLRFDASYEPVVMGKTLFVPSMTTDTVTAFDTETGAVRWTFFADGPVRFAPVAWRNNIYFVCDDGRLYCVNARTGALAWTFTPVPPADRGRKVLGDERLVSRWPARGGPVLIDGTVYFAAGIFPLERVWVCAVRADSGEPAWVNAACALAKGANQDHGGQWNTGLSPQGYLSRVEDKLCVPGGRGLPAFFDLRTGEMDPYSMGWGGRTGLAKGSWYVASIGPYFFQSGDLYGPKPDVPDESRKPGWVSLDELARDAGASLQTVERWVKDLGLHAERRDGKRVIRLENWAAAHLYWRGSLRGRPERERYIVRTRPRLQIDPANDRRSVEAFREPVLTSAGVYYSQTFDMWLKKKEEPHPEIVAIDLRKPVRWRTSYVEGHDVAPRDLVPWRTVEFKSLWRLPSKLKVHIKTGSRLYAGAPGVVAAIHLPRPGEKPRVSWRAGIEGTPSRMLAGDGKLFVVTAQGALYAFGSGRSAPRTYGPPRPTLPARDDEWKTRAARMLAESGAAAGYALVLGAGSGRLIEELLRQSKLRLIILEPDQAEADAARRRLFAAGFYAARAHVLPADLMSVDLPPYFASAAVSENVARAGLDRGAPFLNRLYACLRPYGGAALFLLNEAEKAKVRRWAAEARPPGAELKSAGSFTLIRRAGAPPGSADWTHAAGDAGNTFASMDRCVRRPLAMLWFGGGLARLPRGRWPHLQPPRVCEGRLFLHWGKAFCAVDIYTGRCLWSRKGVAGGSFVAEKDAVYAPSGGRIKRLDPATGAAKGEIAAPKGRGRAWREFRIWGEYLVGVAGKELLCLNRRTGKMLWSSRMERDAAAFALGSGKAFCSDYWSAASLRRGGEVAPECSLRCIRLADGRELWRTAVKLSESAARDAGLRPFHLAPHVAYSEAGDIVLFAALSTASKARLRAHKGETGRLLWDKRVPCRRQIAWLPLQAPILTPHRLITDRGDVYDPRTGALLRRGLWGRGPRGCNRALANPYLAFLRDADICWIDLQTGRRTRFHGLRSGCCNSLIAAGGVLSAPNLAYQCSCNYGLFTSVAFVHMPRAAAWHAAASASADRSQPK